jgi:methyl-accepting chemotaxis protein
MAIGLKPIDQTSSAAPAIGPDKREGDDPIPARPIMTETRLKIWFLAAFLAGTFSIGATWHYQAGTFSTIAWPVGIMFVYMAFTRAPAKSPALRDQIGDSRYYLGFLFTLVALAISMYTFSETADADAGQTSLLARIGVSLITLIVGLAFRLFLTQFTMTPEDAQETMTQQADALVSSARRAHKDLKEQTTQFRKELKDSVSKLKTANSQSNTNIRDSVKKHANSIDKLVGANRKMIEGATSNFEAGIATAIENLKQRFASVEIVPEEVQDSIGRAISGLDEAIIGLKTSLDDASEASGAISKSILPVAPIVESMGTDLAKIASASSQLDEIGQQLITTTTNLKALNAPLTEVAADIQKVPTGASETLAKLKDEFIAVEKLRKNLRRS